MPSNPDGYELEDSRESRAVLIDNTAPTVDPLKVEKVNGRVVVRAVVFDGVGPIIRADYAMDGREFRPMRPDDGVLDGAGETFTLFLGALASGGHTVTVRVADEAENEGFAEKQFDVR